MIYRFGDITIDEERDEIRRGSEAVPAQKKVRDLLLYLIRRRDRLVPKEELFEALWPGVVVNEAALTQAVYGARRAVGDEARRPRVLKTVRGRGVRFVAPVEAAEAGEAEEAAPYPSAGPADGSAGGAPPFVGREGLLGELDGALRAAEAGEGGVFLLAGEPGIGKTRAAEEFAKRARARGASVHFGRCHEAPGAPAFWPWVQLLRSQAAASGTEDFAALLGTGAEDVAQIAPELVPRASDRAEEERRRETIVDPGPARFRLFDAVTRLWRRAATNHPAVLVIDDLHRSDPPSWRLLHFLARELRDIGILVVGTYRDADAHAQRETAELLAELARQPGVRSLQLQGLRRPDIALILETMLGRKTEAAVVDSLFERSNGNPFFVTQLAALIASNVAEAGPRTGARLPPSLREAVAQQINGLPETSQSILETASVIGRSFGIPALAAAVEASHEEVIDRLDSCAQSGLVERDPDGLTRFQFAHILLRDALYERLSLRDRAESHARVGRALEWVHCCDRGPYLDELAHHFSAAAPVEGVGRGVDYLRRAGAHARARLAFEHAARHYESALELLREWPDASEEIRCQLLLDLGESQARAGQREDARAHFSEAASLAARIGATEKLAAVALAVTPGFFSIESAIYDPFTVFLLEWALESLPEHEHALRAQTLGRLAMALFWSHEGKRRSSLVHESAKAAARTEHPAAHAYALAARYAAEWKPANMDDRIQIGPELQARADESSDLSLMFMARTFQITTLLEQGAFTEYFNAVEEFDRLACLYKDLHATWYARLFRANVALMNGDLAESMRLAHEFNEIGTKLGDSNAAQSFAAYWATTEAARGNLKGLAEGARAQAKRYPWMVCWRCAEAALLTVGGRLEEASAVIDALVWPDLGAIPDDMNFMVSLGHLAFAAAGTGSQGAANLLFQALEPYAERHLTVGYGTMYWGSAARPLAVLSDALGRGRDGLRYSALAREAEMHLGVSLWWVDRVAEQAANQRCQG